MQDVEGSVRRARILATYCVLDTPTPEPLTQRALLVLPLAGIITRSIYQDTNHHEAQAAASAHNTTKNAISNIRRTASDTEVEKAGQDIGAD